MKPGSILRNGAIVLHSREAYGHRDYVVLAYSAESPDSFITWNVSSDGNAFWGHYFSNLFDAVEDFKLRTAEDEEFEGLTSSYINRLTGEEVSSTWLPPRDRNRYLKAASEGMGDLPIGSHD